MASGKPNDANKKSSDGVSGRNTGAVCRCSSTVNAAQKVPEKFDQNGAAGGSTIGKNTRKKSGSLDQLLFLTDQLAAQAAQQYKKEAQNHHFVRKEITADDLFHYLKEINGDLQFVDKKQLAELLMQNTATLVAKRLKEEEIKEIPPPLPPHQILQKQPSGTGTIKRQARRQDSGSEKFFVPKNASSTNTTLDSNKNVMHQTKRSSSSSKFIKSETIDVPAQEMQEREFSKEWFNRSQFQRHSSRSVDASSNGKKEKDENANKHQGQHQRHSSGPSNLETLTRRDISQWLNTLPNKKDAQLIENFMENATKGKIKSSSTPANAQSTGSKPKLRNEYADIIRAPSSQQPHINSNIAPPIPQKQSLTKAPEDLQALQNNLLDWLNKKQQKQHMIQQQQHFQASYKYAQDQKAQSSTLSKKVHPKLQKRHSLGPHEEAVFDDKPNWIQVPKDKLGKLRDLQASCLEMNKKPKEKSERQRAMERKLRHSASEVVQTTLDRNYPQNPQSHPQTSTQQHQQQQYQYQIQTLPRNKEPIPSQQIQQPVRYPTSLSGQHQTKGHGHSHGERLTRRDKPRHRQTQRSATTSDILQNQNQFPSNKMLAETAKAAYQSTTTLSRCADPLCPLLPICTDPSCYLNENALYDTPRRASLPRSVKNNAICMEKCCQMPCQDPRCCPSLSNTVPVARSNKPHKFKSNSLPRCVETHRSDLFLSGLTKEESYSSLPKSATVSAATGARPKAKARHSNNKLIKSVSAASLNSRRRRHKTVHFGDNLMREVCQNRNLIKPEPSNQAASTEPNIQMLYNFVEGVMSAWVDEEDEHVKSGPDSEPERGAVMKPMHRCNRARIQTIRRVVGEASALKGSLKLGNSRYRHRHWRGTAKDCNERFLRKVILQIQNRNFPKTVLFFNSIFVQMP